jgi:CubicO group peptidase (beta-lactamase class C family)
MRRPVPEIHGEVAPGFEPLREAFAENFASRGELGAACCVHHRGAKVVDLWGGVRNRATGEPWERDTMVLVHSATKGPAAMTLALAHSRGWLDYDAPVSDYWPEFAQNGKQRITVRMLLAHQAALFGFDSTVTREDFEDPGRLADMLARQRPAWEPGTRQAYHALSLGFYQGELLRRIDPEHRTLGRFFQDEIATPLGLDFYIRLPESIPNERLAILQIPSVIERLRGFPPAFAIAGVNPRSVLCRSLVRNPAGPLPFDDRRVYARELEVPSGGGVGNASGLAGAYGAFATGALGLRAETLAELAAPARPASGGFHDAFMRGDSHFSLGFLKSSEALRFGSLSSYGAPGAGGSLGYADPEAQIGYAYVTNRMGVSLPVDPRDVALRAALDSVL